VSIAEIAVSVGFFDQFYFSRVFKKVKGVPPSKYLAALEKDGYLDFSVDERFSAACR
jgi:AraC-like DNA-binding protein